MEKLLQLEIPPMAQWMRVMLRELTRINSHLVWLGTHALDIGAMSVFFYCFREREDILRIFEMFSGQRMMTSYIRLGGLALEPPRGWHKALESSSTRFRARSTSTKTCSRRNPIWLGRTQGVGYLPLEDMLDLGVTGPMIRAAGVAWDIRKIEPYSSYEKFDFEIATRTANDVYARYQVRMDEMRESAKIVRQALDRNARRPVAGRRAEGGAARARKDEDADGSAHLPLQDRDRRLPRAGRRGVQADRIAARRDRLLRRQRRHVASPTASSCARRASATCRRCRAMIEGCLIADTIAAMGSMDFVLGDVDR